MTAEQVRGCYNVRGKSKRWEKRRRNRAQRRVHRCETPGRCLRGWAD
jgi:hypothetical protein